VRGEKWRGGALFDHPTLIFFYRTRQGLGGGEGGEGGGEKREKKEKKDRE